MRRFLALSLLILILPVLAATEPRSVLPGPTTRLSQAEHRDLRQERRRERRWWQRYRHYAQPTPRWAQPAWRRDRLSYRMRIYTPRGGLHEYHR